MYVETQFSIFLVNKPGVLASVADALAKARVNLVALTIEFGEHSAGMPTINAFHSAWWLVAAFVAVAAITVWRMRV